MVGGRLIAWSGLFEFLRHACSMAQGKTITNKGAGGGSLVSPRNR
jgi:hypothetical protein